MQTFLLARQYNLKKEDTQYVKGKNNKYKNYS